MIVVGVRVSGQRCVWWDQRSMLDSKTHPVVLGVENAPLSEYDDVVGVA